MAVAIRVKKLGENHLDVAEFVNNLAFLYRQFKNFPQAKEHFQKVLSIKEKCLPTNHPGIKSTMEDLAHAYNDLGDKAKANEYSNKPTNCLEKREKKVRVLPMQIETYMVFIEDFFHHFNWHSRQFSQNIKFYS